VQSLTDTTAHAFGLSGDARGALVAGIASHSPAKRAGLVAGDIILEADGRPIRDSRDLDLLIGMKSPGNTMHLKTYRDGQERELSVVLIEEPLEKPPGSERDSASRLNIPLGLSVQTAELSPETRGVLVTDVKAGSPAATAQISEGDLIIEINRKAITNTEEFENVLRAFGRRPVLLLIERSGKRLFVVVAAE
jgi:serine protease Do